MIGFRRISLDQLVVRGSTAAVAVERAIAPLRTGEALPCCEHLTPELEAGSQAMAVVCVECPGDLMCVDCGNNHVDENAESKAKRYLAEGRVIIVRVSDDRVLAQVRGDGQVWLVMFEGGVWSCPCPAITDQCSHLRALRLITAPEVGRMTEPQHGLLS